jgi:hypothetical protein
MTSGNAPAALVASPDSGELRGGIAPSLRPGQSHPVTEKVTVSYDER